jgi:hypothetical protein
VSSALKQRISDDMKTAMRNKDKERLGTIRLLLAAIKQREVDERIELDDSQILAILDKMVKQRHDSKSQFEAANRMDLANKEAFEITVLQDYLPQALSRDEIERLIAQALNDTGASGMRDMGKVMEIVRPQVQGRADMGLVSGLVKAQLQ